MVLAKKAAHMMASFMAFLCRHIVIFGVVKFCAGLVIGFGLGVYFLLILIAEKGRVRQRVASRHVCSEFAWVR